MLKDLVQKLFISIKPYSSNCKHSQKVNLESCLDGLNQVYNSYLENTGVTLTKDQRVSIILNAKTSLQRTNLQLDESIYDTFDKIVDLL